MNRCWSMKRYLPFWCCYLHQGMITALSLQGIVAYFRYAGMDLAQLSWLSLCMLPWVAKFMWAPWGERHALPLRGTPYLGSLVLLQLAMALLLAGMAWCVPGTSIGSILVLLILLSVLSASHDIYADGMTICSTNASTRPYANVAQVGGSYLGILFGSFAFLLLAQYLGWSRAFLGMAALSVLLLLPLLLPPLLRKPAQCQPDVARRSAHLNLSGIQAMWPALALTALYYPAMRGVLALQTVILVDQGQSSHALGPTMFVYSTIASGIGVLLGGWLAKRLGALRCLLPVMALQAALAMLLALGYSYYALRTWLLLFAVVNVAAAIGFVTLYNVLMGQVRAQQPASDYALLQSVDAALSMLMMLAALRLSNQIGYQCVLALLALLGIASLWLVSHLLRQLVPQLLSQVSTAVAATSHERHHG